MIHMNGYWIMKTKIESEKFVNMEQKKIYL